jgi:OOP family OmpA-OmpF porin
MAAGIHRQGRYPMKRTLLGLALGLGVTAGLLAGAASADPLPDGWYVGGDLGLNFRQDTSTRSQYPELGSMPAELRFHTNKEGVALARVGYRVAPHFRLELEGGWRTSRMKSIVDYQTYGRPPGSITNVCGPPAVNANDCGQPGGRIGAWTVMTNAYLDLDPLFGLRPFFGVGAGVARVSTQASGALIGESPQGSVSIDGADWRAAYQAIGGVSYRINRRLDADLSYRFLYSGGHEANATTTGDIPLGRIDGPYEDHAVTLGLRYSL